LENLLEKDKEKNSLPLPLLKSYIK